MTTVGDLMTDDIVTVELPGTREDVIEILRSGDFSSVPVEKDGTYRGLVSREELLQKPDEDQLAMLMREVPTVTEDASVEDCAAVMLDEEERRIPVVTDSTVVGIVTLTDMVAYVADQGIAEDVGEYVSDGVLTTWIETPVAVAHRTLTLADASAACALDDDGEMVGILTETDCIRVADTDTHTEEIGESVAGQDDDWMWEGIKSTSTQLIPVTSVTFPDGPVGDYMVQDVVTVVRSTDVSDAAATMTENGVQHLPILRGDSLVGMVRDTDLVRAIL
jgi:CBS domain-containing protein